MCDNIGLFASELAFGSAPLSCPAPLVDIGSVRTRGFSMIELVIVIVIIGVISAIAIPRFSRAAQTSSFNATQASWVAFEKQMLLYEATYSEFPPAMAAGEFANELKDFIRAEDWLAPPPLGGAWMWASSSGGLVGVGIQQSPVPTALWQQYDRAFDDGNTGTGVVQIKVTRLMRILSDANTPINVTPGGELLPAGPE